MILRGYISNATGGSKRLGMLNMARDLMRGNAAEFKQGYTAENAYIAVCEQAIREGVELSDGDKSAVAGALGVDAGSLDGAIRR